MTRVLVLGSTGMLGHLVLKWLKDDTSLAVDGTHRSTPIDALWFDASMGVRGLSTLGEQRGRYAYIINCIGMTKAKINEEDSRSIRQAIAVNALFPHDLAAWAAERDTRVIHISTDGVFAGIAEAYLEDAPHDCTDVYGKTKSLGDVRTPDCLTLRCSIIGPDPSGKSGLLEWFKGQPEGKTLVGYTHHLWNGVTTLQFAELCRRIITQECFQTIWDESPVHHFCPNLPVSKYDLLQIFRSAFQKDVSITPVGETLMPVRRILATHYHSIKRLFGTGFSMEQAVSDLVTWSSSIQ